MSREIDAEYAWWMNQLQDVLDEQIRLQASATPDRIKAVGERIGMIKLRIEDLLRREMKPVAKP